METLNRSTVTIFGVGGVGSFAAEGLVRAGIGRVILVDFDRICVTNVNRQIHAMKGTLGKSKVAIMAERLRAINPDAVIEARAEFYSAESSERLLTPEPDMVIDAIDNLTAKTHLIATCLRHRIRVISSMGAAQRLDPTRVRVADLMDTQGCTMARAVRKLLRKHHALRDEATLGVPAIYSDEPTLESQLLPYDEGVFQCVCPGGSNGLHDCEKRNVILGSSPFVPSMFGMTAASVAVRWLTGGAPVTTR